MLIQNISDNLVPAYQSDRTAGDGVSVSAVAAPVIQLTSPPVETQPATAPVTAPPPTTAELKNQVDVINSALKHSASKNLEFSIDPDTKRALVRLIDTTTGEVIQQYPSEAMLGISKSIGQFQERLQQAALSKGPTPSTPGLLVKQNA
jgi:flagellar protein FlaG